MENECEFVCSRGILKSCDFYSKNPKSSCNNDTKYLLDMIQSNKLKDNMSIYVCSDLLKFFVNNILPKIKNNFVLVSGDSDMCVPVEALSQKETFILLKSQYLLRWFTQNTRLQDNEKINQMPIGLDYHTIFDFPNCSWISPGEKRLPLEQENILKNVISETLPFYERIPKIFANFSKGNDRFKQREKSLTVISKDLIEMQFKFVPRTQVWQKMKDYTFVLSPFGVGMDCHRTWEALCLGCIPILCAPNFKKLFEELPVLIVNDWTEINEELLNNTVEEFKNRIFNYDKLRLIYWVNKIRE
jgi:hypothetical protein